MLTILVFEIKEGKNAQRPHVWGHTPPPPPPSLHVKKGPGFCMCFYKQMSMIV